MSESENTPLPIFLDIFRRADKNDDGALSWAEFKAFFADGILSEEDLKNLFHEIDTHETNNIDIGELCAYFSQHLGSFEALFKAAEELNSAVNTALHTTAEEYPKGSLFDKFTTRFLLSEIVNHTAALQGPLEIASDTLDAQAKEEITDLRPATATGSSPQTARGAAPDGLGDLPSGGASGGAVLPGRIGRRARKQFGSQGSYPGSEGGSGVLEQQLDRLRLLVDRMENSVNFDGIPEEEVDANDDNQMLIVHRKLIVNESCAKSFRSSLRNYVEDVGREESCMHISVRSYINSTIFAIYEIWSSEDDWKSFVRGDVSKRFQRNNIDHLEVPEQAKTLAVPMSWWNK